MPKERSEVCPLFRQRLRLTLNNRRVQKKKMPSCPLCDFFIYFLFSEDNSLTNVPRKRSLYRLYLCIIPKLENPGFFLLPFSGEARASTATLPVILQPCDKKKKKEKSLKLIERRRWASSFPQLRNRTP